MTKEKDFKSVWTACLEIIKDNIGGENAKCYTTWFEPIVPIGLQGNELTIQVPSQFFYEWLEQNYMDLLKHAIRKTLGPQGMLKYSILVDTSISDKPLTTSLQSSSGAQIQNAPHDMPFPVGNSSARPLNPFVLPGIQKVRVNSQLSENYSLDNFVEGDCNRLARAAGFAVAQRPGTTAYNPLLLHGGVGLGKTHLANAIGLKTKEYHPDKTVLYVTSEQFMQQFAEAGKNKTTNDFIHF